MNIIEKIGNKTDSLVIRMKGLKKDKFNTSHRRLVMMTKEAYKNNLLRTNEIGNFKLVPELSTNQMAVYRNLKNKTIIISVRGTSNLKDLLTDLSLSIESITTNQFDKLNRNINQVKSQHPDFKFIYTGHSLGATKILDYVSKFGGNGVVFNSYIPQLDRHSITLLTSTPNVIKYSILGDIFSNNIFSLKKADTNAKLLTINKVGLINKHSINSFVNL